MTTRRRTGSNGPGRPMISSMEATKAVNFHRNDALVVSTSSALRDWSQVSERRDLDVDLSDCVDRAPAVGLGLALAQPEGKVLVLDCDATLRTNLGGLATIGESNPKNLVHFVFDDVSSSSTSALPIKELDNLDLSQMALSSGYAKSYEFNKLEELLIGLEDVMRQKGPIFVRVNIFREGEPNPYPERSMAQGWAMVKETLSPSEKESD